MPKGSKLKGKMSSYAFFVQTCREEQKKKHPDESVVFSEFSKKCSEKWKAMTSKEKKRFEDMAIENSSENGGGKGKGKKKRTKDPNAPKRSLSGFFFFCNEERPKVRSMYPDYGVGDVAKELGKRWEVCQNRSKYEEMAALDKQRYQKEMKAYRAAEENNQTLSKKPQKKKGKAEENGNDEDEEEDENDEDMDDDE